MIETRSLVVVTPVKGGVSVEWAKHLATMTMLCRERGWRMESPLTNACPGHLSHARNVLLGELLATSSPEDDERRWALWQDADTVADVGAIERVIDRPELAAGDCILRAYPARDFDASALTQKVEDLVLAGRDNFTRTDLERAAFHVAVRPAIENGRPVTSDDGQLVEMEFAGFGWVLFRVDALRSFAAWLEAAKPAARATDWTGRPMVRAFDLEPTRVCRHNHGVTQPQGRAFVAGGEDVAFWQWWCAAGRRAWCAPAGLVLNGGRAGCYAEHLRDVYDLGGFDL